MPHFIEVRAQNTNTRHERVKQKVNELFNKERKRFDDVIAQVAHDFCISERTVKNILKGYDRPKSASNPNTRQLSMF